MIVFLYFGVTVTLSQVISLAQPVEGGKTFQGLNYWKRRQINENMET